MATAAVKESERTLACYKRIWHKVLGELCFVKIMVLHQTIPVVSNESIKLHSHCYIIVMSHHIFFCLLINFCYSSFQYAIDPAITKQTDNSQPPMGSAASFMYLPLVQQSKKDSRQPPIAAVTPSIFVFVEMGAASAAPTAGCYAERICQGAGRL